MTAVFVGMIVSAGAGFGVASALAAYAHRAWGGSARRGAGVEA